MDLMPCTPSAESIAPMGSLALAILEQPSECWSVTFGERTKAVLVVQLHEAGADLKLYGGWDAPKEGSVTLSERSNLDIRVKHPCWIKAGTFELDSSHLFQPEGELNDRLDGAFEILYRMGRAICLRSPEGPETPALSLLTSALHRIQSYLRDQCQDWAIKAAEVFPAENSLRWKIFKLVAQDPTGRLAQLAWTCPGLCFWPLSLRKAQAACLKNSAIQ